MAKLKGRRVVLTGATRGIGLEAVKLFTAEGAEILGLGRDADKLKKLEAQFGSTQFQGLAGDMADLSLGQRVADAVTRRWGALDLLINNAGIQTWKKDFRDETLELMVLNFNVNFIGPYALLRALLPLLEKGTEPRVINVSSGAGQIKVVAESADMPAYRLSKLALNGQTRMLANALKGKVAVNSLDPGWLKTDLGGPSAPGEPPEGAQRMLALALKPFSETGKFWYGADEIEF